MRRTQQLKWVGGIVVAGVLAALPFARKTEPIAPLAPGPISPVLQNVPLHLAADSTPSPAVGLRDHDPPPATPPSVIVTAPAGSSRLEDNGIPPELPDRFQPLSEAPPLAPAATPPARRALPLGQPKVRMSLKEEAAAPREWTHRIVDGDTLPRLAQRYWQDAALADVLYEANRAVLSAPDPLPIGLVLTIPAQPPRVSQRNVELVPQSADSPEPVRQPMPTDADQEGPLVPIDYSSR